jgi:hypothetical protein
MRSVGEKPWLAHGRGLKTEAWGGSAERSLAVQRQNVGIKAGKFRKHVADDIFSGIIVGFALQKA